jgi:hypothetical protein
MGLDMYLTGSKYFHRHGRPRERGEIKEERYELGYWRKHPNLHGFIVEMFADGQDECQEIELSAEDIKKIIGVIEARRLPETTGFFFGESEDTAERTAEDVKLFREALAWLETEEDGVWRSVTYQASW